MSSSDTVFKIMKQLAKLLIAIHVKINPLSTINTILTPLLIPVLHDLYLSSQS